MVEKFASDSPVRVRSHWDIISIGSFIAAGGLSVATLCNNIRQKFYQSFVLGHKGSKTSFHPIIAEYDGEILADGTRTEGLFAKRIREFAEKSEQFHANQIDATALHKEASTYHADMRQLAKDMRQKIAKQLLTEHDIPTYGPRGLTVGIVKRWQELGKHARMDTGLGFAAITALGIGAVATLRHSKRTIDAIDDRLNQSEAQSR